MQPPGWNNLHRSILTQKQKKPKKTWALGVGVDSNDSAAVDVDLSAESGQVNVRVALV